MHAFSAHTAATGESWQDGTIPSPSLDNGEHACAGVCGSQAILRVGVHARVPFCCQPPVLLAGPNRPPKNSSV